MEKYDYKEAIKADIRDYCSEHDVQVNRADREQIEENLYDTLFVNDQVTGNASGSYTFNTWRAEEYLCHNLDLLGEALAEFGCDITYLTEKGVEACDVTIRCYLLGECINEVLNEMQKEKDDAD